MLQLLSLLDIELNDAADTVLALEDRKCTQLLASCFGFVEFLVLLSIDTDVYAGAGCETLEQLCYFILHPHMVTINLPIISVYYLSDILL